MDKDEIIRRLEHENELFKESIKKLEAQLAKYENVHTPPSLKCGNNSKNSHKKSDGKNQVRREDTKE